MAQKALIETLMNTEIRRLQCYNPDQNSWNISHISAHFIS